MSGNPQPPVPYGYLPPPLVRPTSGLATASMVLGIIGFLGGWCLFGIPCFLAVLFGHLALKETKTGERGGHGQAITGLILGYVLAVPWLILSIILVLGAASGSGQ